MVARFLVTTAREETWPTNNEPILFLGDWCKLFTRRRTWEKLDSIVSTYHWNNRSKFNKDFLYLQRLNEALLGELTAKLNIIHKVNYSSRYWRIVVGPWLAFFSQMAFDRWEMIRLALHNNDISDVRIINYQNNPFVPNDMNDFNSMYIEDSWNEFIYGSILAWKKFPVHKIDIKNNPHNDSCNKKLLDLPSGFKKKLRKLINFISGLSYNKKDFFFISSYFSTKFEIFLQFKLGQVPSLWASIPSPLGQINLNARNWQLSDSKNVNDFSSFLRFLIPLHIPINYLEGYKLSKILCKNLPWPKRPKAIFTANSFMFDDVFKVWAAGKTEEGVPLITGQHGGHYGIGSWSFLEEHQIAISDYFLTWGWKKPKHNKVIPFGNIKGFGKSFKAKKTGIALMVQVAIPRQSYQILSSIVSASQWGEYFDDQCRFFEALPDKLQAHIVIRLYPTDYDNSQKERWLERFPRVILDEGKRPIRFQIDKTKLYISTYNATTYLESMSLNIPTIIFWNTKHWELKDSAAPYFEKLKLAGIFHENPESAANQMIKVWDNIEDWWNSPEVQSARIDFCKEYAYIPEKPLETLEKIFLKIADKPQREVI